jgi:hypothetical protein
LPWLKREFGWSEDTAERYMQAHKVFGSDSAQVRNLPDLPLRTFYMLAAPSTPEPARAEVIERAEAGEKLTHAQVKRWQFATYQVGQSSHNQELRNSKLFRGSQPTYMIKEAAQLARCNERSMRTERRDVDDRPDRQREQQMEPHLGPFHHASASSSSPIGSPAPS